MSRTTTLLPALAELQARPQWVCWRKEIRNGKPTKVPYNAMTGRLAESNNPTTWAELAQVEARLHRQPRAYDGIGYMFHRDFTGVDLDHCVREDGSIEIWAQAIIEQLHSYAEYSPSGTGVHILVRGTIPHGLRRKIAHAPHPEAAIEMYCEGRYFTITGKHVAGTPTTLETCEQALSALYAQLTAPRQTPAYREDEHATRPLDLADTQLLEKAWTAKNGAKFWALWNGDTSEYLSESEADLALCCSLAFWTQRDRARMDRLFRQSKLGRDKWDERRGETTYGAMTLSKAIQLCRVVYEPRATKKRLERQIDLLEDALSSLARQCHSQDGHAGKKHQIVPREVEVERVLEFLVMNELGDALLFATCFEGQVCYDASEKKWYVWAGHFWERCVPGKMYHIVAGYLGMIYLQAKATLNVNYAELASKIQALQVKGTKEVGSDLEDLQEQYTRVGAQMHELEARAKALRTAKRTKNVLAYVEGDERIYVYGSVWDADPWLLACQSGVIDLRTGECRPGRPADYIRLVCPTSWQGMHAPCPRFEQFLAEIFEDKPDREALIAFLQRVVGYGITGLSTEHIFPILYGEEGRNGKDTLLSTLSDVLGPLVGAISNDVFIAAERLRATGAATPHLCDLQGKRLVWGSETKQGDKFNISLIKLLTGGGAISARPLYGDQYSFKPTHKLLLMTNYKPHADARDKAFWERVCLIEFGLRFVDRPGAANERKKDASLAARLKEEAPGILAWLVRGCLQWQKQGLQVPPSVQLATSRYREEEDRLLQFIEECCVVSSACTVKASALYEAYKQWCKDNQLSTMNGKLFGDEISKKFEKKHTKEGRIYHGIGLLAANFDPPDRKGEGSPTFSPGPFTHSEAASRASGEGIDQHAGEGCEGFCQEVPLREGVKRNFEGTFVHNPSHPSPAVTTTPTQVAPQADRDRVKGQEAPFTDPSHPSPQHTTHTCTTMWEKPKRSRHLTAATRFVADCWWCERCVPHSTLLTLGHRLNFPELRLPTCRVPAGYREWLRFAQEAGYRMVEQALSVAEHMEQSV